MNTLSPQDSSGYYLPVVIDGFDVNYKNFDHIELQYKLSKHSDDGWVNLCSYYAEDSLYQAASGTKAMITGGRIENIRFYGERDPIEQEYDLRAVSFCRHGNGFISRSSDVRSGIKDTRVPRVFGAPQPADAILGVGNDLKLRFNEPIAGNYLDEDNNFQIIGTTNATGITTGTSLHFEDAVECKAQTQAERSLTNTSFTLDMMVRPYEVETAGTFFTSSMTTSDYLVQFGYAEGGLVLFLMNEVNVYMFTTERDILPAGVFSRVLAVYDNAKKTVQFYLGTNRLPLSTEGASSLPSDFMLRGSAPLRFGGALGADMLEARIWSKALTQDEITATNQKYLTGYERDLMAYYRMDEGRGNELTDRANGATLYCTGTSWNHQKGISVALKSNEQLKLDGNLLGRSNVYDESILLWFKTSAPAGDIFSAGRTDEKHGTLLSMENGRLILHSDSTSWLIGDDYANGEWHHVVLTVNRTMNNAAVYVDGKVKQTFSASLLGSISGAMYLGGNGFEGNIDDIVFFEQALPKYLIQEFDNGSPTGDEMGIFGYLPFEQQIINPNGIMELVFSPNDQRVFRDGDGNIVDKVVPLVIGVEGAASAEALADKINHAPTRDRGMMTKMKFDWSFNNDELLINLNMADREINKQTIYVTVRDVEDLNGNPMASPVSWVAFVDRNALKWSEKTLRIDENYEDTETSKTSVNIINESGRRHQYSIESLPDWVTVDKTSGSLNAEEEARISFTFNSEMPVGVYNDQIYLVDEEGLAEPLIIEFTVAANPPYDFFNNGKYPYNMSICGQVTLSKGTNQVFDSDPNDIVYAMYRTECVGMAHVAFNAQTSQSELYLTVYGNDDMVRKPIHFQLWQASTGKLYDLAASRDILFANGYVYGCGNEPPVVLTTTGNETQRIELNPGWNWISTNLRLTPFTNNLSVCMNATHPWKESDMIKNPATRQFSSYSDSTYAFVGTLNSLHFSQIYMVYTAEGNVLRIAGERLPQDSMRVRLRGDGQWNVIPCLFEQPSTVMEALAGYYDNASPGDIIKSHTRFATFSADKRWVGDLTALRPGEGYLFRRMAPGTVDVQFYKQSVSNAPKKANANANANAAFTNPHAATNMTMIAKLDIGQWTMDNGQLMVYVGDELVGVASPTTNANANANDEALYFLTIQSDKVGELRFEMNGQGLTPMPTPISYEADSHHGSLRAPVVLTTQDSILNTYKVIDHDHVVIIRNGERYDVTGKKVE